MMYSKWILILNIIIWIITTYVLYSKRRHIDSAVFLLITFTIYSLCSLLTYNFRYSDFNGVKLSILPLVYLYSMIILTMSPVLRFDIAKVKLFPNPPFTLLDVLSWAFVICMIIKLPHDITHIQEGMGKIMLDQGGDLYTEVMRESESSNDAYSISSLSSIYVNITTEIIILIAFYNLYKRRKGILTLLLLISIILTPLGSIANGQRGGAFDVIIVLLGTFFLFAPILHKNILKKVKIVGIIVLACLLIPIVALTNSRFGSRIGSSEQSVFSYMGQQNLNFDIYAFDNDGLRYGDRVFPLFKKILGFKNVPNDFWERRIKYPNLKINDEVFIGYIGDFLLDFGVFVSTLLFFIFTFAFLRLTKIKNDKCYFQQLLMIQFVLVLGLQGGLKLYPFADTFSLKIFSFGLLYLYLRHSQLSQQSILLSKKL